VIREHVGHDSVLVTNWWSTRKFIEPLDQRFLPVKLEETPLEKINALAQMHEHYFVVIHDRGDSAFWREQAGRNAVLLSQLVPEPALELDVRLTPGDRVRIWRVGAPAPHPETTAQPQAE
jgi:hypothetical protein